ncbi:MAG: SEC-C metal-binding domain-containing protein [Clostridiales bacterium]|nr:SEC-C metal-binding domain-containing protein [Eubacteriales bacterium]MDH7566758.1 SEC-C metal-binding domain-containing protein [Clostridiales bacterium]
MSLFKEWKELAEKHRTQEEYNKFWDDYLEKEKKNYESILEKKENTVCGKLNQIAEGFGMDPIFFAGFLDGINTSLIHPIDLDALHEDSEINLEIDFEKLYFNMLKAKAEWLYNLPQWDSVLPQEKRTEITKGYNKSRIAVSTKVGRNDPCPCGSGKKYKKCCGSN